MKRILVILTGLLIAASANAQIDLGMPSATGKGGAATALIGNFDALGINPANIGWFENHRFSVGVFNFGISAQSKALDIASLRKGLMNPEDTFSTAQKNEYVKNFSDPNGLNLQAQLCWASFSLNFPKLGGIAVNLRDRTFAHVGLNHNAADIIFNGQNAALFQDTTTYTKSIGQILDSTNISYLHYRELNVAYARRLAAFGDEDADGVKKVQVFGGIGFKYLWGFGNIQAGSENGVLSGHASFSTDYNINYGALNNFNAQTTDLLFNAVGKGMAFDAGASLVLKNKIRFGVALTDLGGITWSNNNLITTDTTMTPPDTTNNGINSWNLSSQGQFAFASNGLFNYSPGPDFKSKLPSRLRVGYGMKIGSRFQLGADAVFPLNNESVNLAHPFFAIGSELNLFSIVKLSAGVAGNSDLGWSVPLGAVVGIGGFVEVSAATGDILSYFAKNDNPNLSIAILAIRVNIRKLDKTPAANTPPTPGF